MKLQEALSCQVFQQGMVFLQPREYPAMMKNYWKAMRES
jgi:hypothetical protein